MAISEAFTGSATIGTTEYSLPNAATYSAGAARTETGVLQLWLDLNALASGDQYTLRLYRKIASAQTLRLAETWSFSGAQVTPIFGSETFIVRHGWDFTLQKITGVDRSIFWSIERVV